MKQRLMVLFILLPLSSLFAIKGEITYLEGGASLKNRRGDIDFADIGSVLRDGESIFTDIDGYVELELDDGSLVTVLEDSVFSISTIQKEGKSRNSFQVALGTVEYKFTKAMKAEEPTISTPSTVCGLRGTDFTVISSLDGSALYIVSDGSVEVSAQGQNVQLFKNEGVSVLAGEVPGDKFDVKRGDVDLKELRAKSDKSFKDNPALGVRGLLAQMKEYADEADNFQREYEAQKEYLNQLDQQLADLAGDDAKKFYGQTVFGQEVRASNLRLNVRYYALGALSIRRYLLGSMYVQMKGLYFLDQDNQKYLDFLDEYAIFLEVFNQRVVPYLVKADI